ncbi:LysR substrate-binding domain-containing protein [Pseudomonas lactis]|jgi:DNA-binding transcriptional LysR family regulator|uniref:LysR family transcriptional regulator n=1 Tax=Pseudomonas lactis TaxID=1615674 RepID=A0A219ABU8_9PSED|nr:MULTISPECIES: LysR substrate-binding domain-containing protein [Pseudomonas]MBD8559189.1 LysR family transcriptional regulator [Pseudomonas fluorescens]MBI6974412.1 LysR family transcriptional regulator [Pseudomonas lactis]MBR7216306.1 LysR family transcriptional regulator [Pseudomonas sp. B2021]MCF4973562.1 LysR family transcriptional regulator [Pseudomonas lactis]MCF5000384.1 LysR family transcriptional regulator [Pseudomonas lactis]
MRLRHIEIFQAIRQTGSISAAAQLLHVSQPAVTKVLQHAELQLGFPLFLRVRGKLQPTSEALALESEVEKVTTSLQGVQRLAKSLRHTPEQSVRIGAIPALAQSLLPPSILEWKRSYPDIACELSSDHSRELVQQLLMREIDLALTLNFSGHPGLTTQILANGALVALASKGYWPESESHKALPLADLASTSLIGLSSADPLAAKLDNYLENVSPPPQISICVQTYSLARAMVESGAGITVIDPFTALSASTATVCIRTLTPPLPITLYALTRAHEPPPHMLADLLQIFGTRARELLDLPQVRARNA